MGRYEILEHTAEVGVAAYGADLREVLEQASAALVGLMWDPQTVAPIEEWPVRAESGDREALVADWLNALLVVVGEEGAALHDVRVDQASETGARGAARGERLEVERHVRRLEVKAATYHGLEVAEAVEGLRARLILDI